MKKSWKFFDTRKCQGCLENEDLRPETQKAKTPYQKLENEDPEI